MTVHIDIADVEKVDVIDMLTERCKQYNLANGMTEKQWNRMMGIQLTAQEAPDERESD